MTPRPSDGEVLAVLGLAERWCRGLAQRQGDCSRSSAAAGRIAEGGMAG